ncbi:MAG: YegS/Rv2252/BmrU family lipid kinase [Lachnospiraceae bacterium]|nr:YegS/Rv2252/BmrU family lipid kinase [Lachnospiraceae bacterium]
MKKMLFVYNPKSGKGQIRFNLSRIIERFSMADFDVTVYPTKAVRDAAQTVCARAADFDMIVCSGGDGTLDEVVTGLMESGVRRPIGYIPAGSTNDFAGSIGIPRQMERAADTIVSGEQFCCDIGHFNDRDYFVYVAAFGLLTDVSYQTKQELKNVLGHAAYIIEGVKRLGSWRSYSIEVESDEFCGNGDFIYGMVSNSNSVGGIKGLPGRDVELDDGLFEVLLVRTPVDLIDWQQTIGALLMNDESNKNVIRFKTRCLVIRSEEPVAWTLDGEDGGEFCTVKLENLHRVLDIMAGAGRELHEPADEREQLQQPEDDVILEVSAVDEPYAQSDKEDTAAETVGQRQPEKEQLAGEAQPGEEQLTGEAQPGEEQLIGEAQPGGEQLIGEAQTEKEQPEDAFKRFAQTKVSTMQELSKALTEMTDWLTSPLRSF